MVALVRVRGGRQELAGSGTVSVWPPRRPRAILATVMLFFHEQVEPAQSPRRVAMAFAVVRQRPAEADQGQPALVAKEVAHREQKIMPRAAEQQSGQRFCDTAT